MAKLTAEQLKALPDSMFGLPKERKYPMPDEEHVRKAIQFFRYCEESKRSELAKNINRRAKELKMKLKIQPSSLFYKYADKEILKEAVMFVNEFHIGQISPIVPLDGKMVEKRPISQNKSKAPLDKLKALWDSKKSLSVKKEESMNILKDVIKSGEEITTEYLITYDAIADLCYMLESNMFDYIQGINGTEFINRKGRSWDFDNQVILDYLQDFLNADAKEQHMKLLYDISDPAILSKIIAYINYSGSFTPEFKARANEIFLNRVNTNSHLSLPNTPQFDSEIDIKQKEGISEDDEFIIKNFLEKTEGKENNIKRTICKLFKHKGQIESLTDLYQFKNIVNFYANWINYCWRYAYYITNDFIFIKMGRSIYIGEFANVKREFSPMEKAVLCVKIYDPNEKEYNDDIISYFIGVPNMHFGIKLQMINLSNNPANLSIPKLEAADFNSVINGIKITKNGTVSLVFDFNFSWKEKLTICKEAIKECKDNKDTDGYKNNLTFLFSLICYIHKVYIKEQNSLVDSDGYDYKDAMDTLNEAQSLFKSEIANISKIDKKFDFIDYYLKSKSNDKINIFDAEEKDDLRKEVEIAYYWIF